MFDGSAFVCLSVLLCYFINAIGPRGCLNCNENGVPYWEKTKLENKAIHKQTERMLSLCISSSAYAKIDVSWISAQAENMPLWNSHSINSEVQEVNKELRVMKYKCTLAQIMVTVFNDHFGKGCKTRLLAARSGKVGSGLGNICPVQCAAHSWDSFPPSSSKMDEFPLSEWTKQTHSFCDQQRTLLSVS